MATKKTTEEKKMMRTATPRSTATKKTTTASKPKGELNRELGKKPKKTAANNKLVFETGATTKKTYVHKRNDGGRGVATGEKVNGNYAVYTSRPIGAAGRTKREYAPKGELNREYGKTPKRGGMKNEVDFGNGQKSRAVGHHTYNGKTYIDRWEQDNGRWRLEKTPIGAANRAKKEYAPKGELNRGQGTGKKTAKKR